MKIWKTVASLNSREDPMLKNTKPNLAAYTSKSNLLNNPFPSLPFSRITFQAKHLNSSISPLPTPCRSLHHSSQLHNLSICFFFQSPTLFPFSLNLNNMASQESVIASQQPLKPPQEPKRTSPEPKITSQEPKITSPEPEVISQEPKLTSQEPNTSFQGPLTTTSLNLSSKFSNRVVLKTILEPSDRALQLLGKRVVVGGWVKSSKEVTKEPVPPPQPQTIDRPDVSPGPKDMSCVEIFQSRIPIFRSIMKILGGGSGGGGSNYPVREQLEPENIPRLPPSSVAYLLVSDGSCIASLQVVVDSSLASPSQLLPIGTCILAEGVIKQPAMQGKHSIELEVEKILHVGTVEPDKYPLSKKRIQLEMLRDCSHFRPRTTTVATVMRIRSALTFATQTFFHDNEFLYVQVPILTTTDGGGFSEKFQVTTLLGKEGKEAAKASDDTGGVSLEAIKAAVIQKSNLVEELKRSDSNREALVSAIQDLRKTNQLASQLEAKEKLKSGPSMKADKAFFLGEFFSQPTYLSVSGLLHLESYACALGNVFSFGPRFRADRKESANHVAEMWMVEVQMAFSQLEDAINCADNYFKFLCKWISENCSEDMKFVCKRIDKNSINRLESMMSCSIVKISYMEAVDILKKNADKFGIKIEWGIALTAEHLSYLADGHYKKPVIIYDYPKELMPFYVRLNDDGKTAAAFEMVLPKVGRIITGSQSEERIDMLSARIEELSLPKEQYEWYLDLRRHGTVNHSGFSVGFDLMVLFATGLPDVRDAIPFPRSRGKFNN